MRKKNFAYAVDTAFWWFVATIPFIVFIATTIAWCCGLNSFSLGCVEVNMSGQGQDFLESYTKTTYLYPDAFKDFIIDTSSVGIAAVNSIFDFYMPDFDCELNPIMVALDGVANVIVPDTASSDFGRFVLCSLGWFIYAHIIHLFVDFILFIPRLAHKWMGKAYQDD